MINFYILTVAVLIDGELFRPSISGVAAYTSKEVCETEAKTITNIPPIIFQGRHYQLAWNCPPNVESLGLPIIQGS